jgi:four helix bundle protein
MDKTEPEERTKRFALDIIRMVGSITDKTIHSIVGYQVIKSGTSIGANYREAARAVSKADFVNKIGIVEKEASETCYWLELLRDSQTIETEIIGPLLAESNELLAIFAAAGRTAKRKP